MVNKPFQSGHLVRSFIFLFSVLISSNGLAQSLDKYYVSSVESTGTLYFFNPIENFESPDGSELNFDCTYRSDKDSTTVNFTIITTEKLNADSLCLSQCYKAVRLYLDADGKKWVYRYTSTLPLSEIKTLLTKSDPEITVTGNKKKSFRYKRNWKRKAEAYSKIFYLIENN